LDDEIAEMALQVEADDKYRIFSELMLLAGLTKIFFDKDSKKRTILSILSDNFFCPTMV